MEFAWTSKCLGLVPFVYISPPLTSILRVSPCVWLLLCLILLTASHIYITHSGYFHSHLPCFPSAPTPFLAPTPFSHHVFLFDFVTEFKQGCLCLHGFAASHWCKGACQQVPNRWQFLPHPTSKSLSSSWVQQGRIGPERPVPHLRALKDSVCGGPELAVVAAVKPCCTGWVIPTSQPFTKLSPILPSSSPLFRVVLWLLMGVSHCIFLNR